MGCGSSKDNSASGAAKPTAAAIAGPTTAAAAASPVAEGAVVPPPEESELASGSCTDASLRTKATQHRAAVAEAIANKRKAAASLFHPDDGGTPMSFERYRGLIEDHIKEAVAECLLDPSSNAPDSYSFAMVRFIAGLPSRVAANPTCAASLKESYTPAAVKIVLHKAAFILETLVASKEDVAAYATKKAVVDHAGFVRRVTMLRRRVGDTEASSGADMENAALSSAPSSGTFESSSGSGGLTPAEQEDWAFALYNREIDPATAVDYLLAVFLYTVDWKVCACASLAECARLRDTTHQDHRSLIAAPQNKAAHGPNAAVWSVANWMLRVTNDHAAQPSKASQDAAASLAVFDDPFCQLLDQALSVLPASRDVVFRGVNVLGIAERYTLGFPVTFAPFTSTSMEGKEAMKYAKKDGTYFALRCRGAVLIDFLSFFPREAEKLLASFSCFTVLQKTSPTLLRMLQCPFDVVTLAEQRGPAEAAPVGISADEQAMDDVVRATTSTQFIFDRYLTNGYVEPLVSHRPPPTGNAQRLLTKAHTWLMGEHGKEAAGTLTRDDFVRRRLLGIAAKKRKHLVVVGPGGSGKTSALLAVHSMFVGKKQTPPAKRLFSFFVPLPAVPNIAAPGAIDAFVAAQNNLSVEQLSKMGQKFGLIALLDSIDEVNWNQNVGSDDASASPAMIARLACHLLRSNPVVSSTMRVVVAARTEWLQFHEVRPSDIFDGVNVKPDVIFLQPFLLTDRQSFITLNVPAVATGAGGGSDHQLTSSDVDGVAQHPAISTSPCVLAMLCQTPKAAVLELTRVVNSGGALPPDKWKSTGVAAVFAAYLENIVPKPQLRTAFLEGIASLALRFMNTSVWQCTVAEAKKAFPGTPTDAAVLYGCVPRRVENDADPKCLFSLWYKGVTEFALAWSLAERPIATVQAIAIPFARRFPAVLQYFSELVNDSPERRRAWLATGGGAAHLWELASSKFCDPSVASNALSLLAAGRFDFDGRSLTGLTFKGANLASADLSGCRWTGATFLECDFSGAHVDRCDVDHVLMKDCMFEIEGVPFDARCSVAHLVVLESRAAHASDRSHVVVALCGSTSGAIAQSLRFLSVSKGNVLTQFREWSPPLIGAEGAETPPIVALVAAIESTASTMVAVASASGAVFVFDSESGLCLATLPFAVPRAGEAATPRSVQSLDFVAVKKDSYNCLIGCSDGTLWSAESAAGKPQPLIRVLPQPPTTTPSSPKRLKSPTTTSAVAAVSFQGDGPTHPAAAIDQISTTSLGRFVACLSGDVLSMCRSTTMELVSQRRWGDDSARGVHTDASATAYNARSRFSLASDEACVLWSKGGEVVVVDLPQLRSTACKAISMPGGASVRDAVLAQGQYAFTATDDGVLRQWELSTGGCIRTCWGHTGAIRNVAVVDEDTVVTGGDDGTVRLWAVGATSEAKQHRFTCVGSTGIISATSDAVASYLFSAPSRRDAGAPQRLASRM